MRSKFYVTVLLIVYFILCKYYWLKEEAVSFIQVFWITFEGIEKIMNEGSVKAPSNLFEENKEIEISYMQIFQNQQCLWRDSNEIMKEFFKFMGSRQ